VVAVIVNPTRIAGSWHFKASGGFINPDIVCCLCNTRTTVVVVYGIQPFRKMKNKDKGGGEHHLECPFFF
jgi:hypothetical protein